MKVIILAGGKGTRLAEETQGVIPKPMVNIGGKPMLYHIMRLYLRHGYNEFIIATGHLHEVIERWIADNPDAFPGKEVWANPIFTGEETGTAGRLAMLRKYLAHDRYFMMTYGDGLSNVNLRALSRYHGIYEAGNIGLQATMTVVNPPVRFGTVSLRQGLVTKFGEKRQEENSYINGGFFQIKTELLDTIASNKDFEGHSFEYDYLPLLAQAGQLAGFSHSGYWQMMDTPRDKQQLEEDYQDGIPWEKGT